MHQKYRVQDPAMTPLLVIVLCMCMFEVTLYLQGCTEVVLQELERATLQVLL
jgi:hypothetical protein